MTGPEHYSEAERLLAGVTMGTTHPDGSPVIRSDEPETIAAAQVHATLALAAAFACARLGELPVWDADAWQDLAGTQPSEPDVAAAPDAAAEGSRRLDAIRGVLARFDWEHDDRQLALEAIERIVDDEDQADEPSDDAPDSAP